MGEAEEKARAEGRGGTVSSTIDIVIESESDSDCDAPTYGRSMVHFRMYSDVKFEKVTYTHLGFHARSDGKRAIKHRGDRFVYWGLLEPNIDAQATIGPFRLYLQNVGDGFVGVHVRMPYGMERCKMTILQEENQPKAPKEIDDFIKFE
jgi:hypothetical protein